jgi:hypothetical protein
MADDSTNYLVSLILGMLVIAVVVFFIYYSGIIGRLEIFPTFGKSTEITKWKQEFFLEHPQVISYYIYGNDADIYFYYVIDSYSKAEIWQWKQSAIAPGFVNVNNKGPEYKKLSQKNRIFVDSLADASAEEGLELIVNRVLANQENNRRYNVWLYVYIGDKEYQYEATNPLLKDLDGFIDKLNQLSRGYVKQTQ